MSDAAKAATPSTAEIPALVSEGAKLSAELKELKAKETRLDEIKALLRLAAGNAEKTFSGAKGEVAVVKPVADSTVRSVPETLLASVKALAGRALLKLFHLAPVKDFELNALKTIDKANAEKLVRLLKVPSSARVSFAAAAK